MTPSPLQPRKTRIVATLGPSSRPPEVLDQLLLAGVDVVRINCSHLAPGQIREEVARVRAAIERTHPASILVDLQGPKIRTGNVPVPLDLPTGSLLTIVMDAEALAGPDRVGTTYPELARDLVPGQKVVFADGELSGEVEGLFLDREPAEMTVRLTDGGTLGSHKGINVPGAALSTPSLTTKDLRDLEEAVGADVDYIALSFVRRASDVDGLREHLRRLGAPDQPICAKIEKPQALEELPAILERVEAIMVARGDLGVETPLCRLPLVQKDLIQAANQAGVLVITATQMLESMMENPLPTRAEVTDVGNAILDGTDAVMLSGETAAGAHPLAAVRVMDSIAREVEASPWFTRPVIANLPFPPGFEGAISRAAAYAARELDRPLVVFTWTGASAILLCKSRPPRPIYALTPNESTFDRLALAWGVTPVRIPVVTDVEELILVGEKALVEGGYLPVGAEIVVVGGNAPSRGASNFMKVERLTAR